MEWNFNTHCKNWVWYSYHIATESYQIEFSMIPVAIWCECHYFSFCSVWTTIYVPHNHHVRCSQPCKIVWILWTKYCNLMKTYIQDSKLRLLQPYYNLVEIFIPGAIFLDRQNWYTIHQHCLHGTWRAHQKQSLFNLHTICNAVLCEVNQQNTSFFLGLLAI